MERRRGVRKPAFQTQPPVSVTVGRDRFSARLIDSSDEGLGIEIGQPLGAGTMIRVTGSVSSGISVRPLEFQGIVRWCVGGPNGNYRCGLQKVKLAKDGDDEPDYYEVLQLSQTAEVDTINRVFRLLAQRFHPDNKETGDGETFKLVVKAHDVLSNAETRAAYDVRYNERQQTRWRIFEGAETARGVEAERRKRGGVLSLLYVRRMNEPRDPGMTLQELERLLGCPKEHLEFALWFLRENAWISRADNGKVSITAKGAEKAEESGTITPDVRVREDRMIAAPAV
jgi:hypothetical protein